MRLGHQVCVPQDIELKKKIIAEAHCTLLYTAHPGVTKMYQDLRPTFWREEMKKDKTDFVQRCLVCQQIKAKHQKCRSASTTINPRMEMGSYFYGFCHWTP